MAREACTRTRGGFVCEALSTMWLTDSLRSRELIARVMPRLRERNCQMKRRRLDSPLKVGTGLSYRTPVLLGRHGETPMVRERTLNRTSDSPCSERGNEPSQACRQSLPHHGDATYANVGTACVSPKAGVEGVGQPASTWRKQDGAAVVVRGRESLLPGSSEIRSPMIRGEGRQSDTVHAECKLSRRTNVWIV